MLTAKSLLLEWRHQKVEETQYTYIDTASAQAASEEPLEPATAAADVPAASVGPAAQESAAAED